MNTDYLPGITSISSNALLLTATVQLLEQVERLPSGATGALAFGDDGVILVENKRICWAVASDMQRRLTDILCEQKDPPLARADVEDLFRRCKHEGKPMGEALVSSGIISEGDLRAALERHNCEAIIRLAQGRVTTATRFAQHSNRGYDPRYVFTTAELLASLSGRRRRELATEGRRRLEQVLVPDASGFAFLRDERSRHPVIIAVARSCELHVSDALEIASWTARTFDVATFVDRGTAVLRATWCSRVAVIAWREQDVFYAAVCTTRPASALLLTQLSRRLGKAPSTSGAPAGGR